VAGLLTRRAFRAYLLAILLLGAVLAVSLRYAGGRTPLGIGVLVAVEVAAILTALAFSVREIARR
jgi:uncharacterized integral membrane protein